MIFLERLFFSQEDSGGSSLGTDRGSAIPVPKNMFLDYAGLSYLTQILPDKLDNEIFRGKTTDTVNVSEPGIFVYYNLNPDSSVPENVVKGLLINCCDPGWPVSSIEQPGYMYQLLIAPLNSAMYYRTWANGISYGSWYKINATAV